MKLARVRFWGVFSKKGRKGLEIFSVQRRVFCRKGDDFFLFWSTGNEKSMFWKEAEERKNLGEGEMGKEEGGVGKRCRKALHPWTYWLRNREKAGTAWTQSVFCSHCASVLQALSCRPRWREGELAWQGIKTQTQTKHASSVN